MAMTKPKRKPVKQDYRGIWVPARGQPTDSERLDVVLRLIDEAESWLPLAKIRTRRDIDNLLKEEARRAK